MPTIGRLKLSVATLAVSVLFGFLMVILLAFPSEIFNKTFEENEEEIHAGLTRLGLHRHHLSRRVGGVVFALVATALASWIALGSEQNGGNWLAVTLSLLIALPLVTLTYSLTTELHCRRVTDIPGELRVLPAALMVGAGCAVLSQALSLHPAYLYGLFASFAAVRAELLTEEHEGRSVLKGALALALLAAVCWGGWSLLDGSAHGAHRTWPVILLSTTLFLGFTLSAEALVFALLPLDFLDGARLRRWRAKLWLGLQLAAAAFFAYVLVLQGESRINSISELLKPLAFFVVFGLASLAFWGYFHWDSRPTAPGGKEGELPSAAPGGLAVAGLAGDGIDPVADQPPL